MTPTRCIAAVILLGTLVFASGLSGPQKSDSQKRVGGPEGLPDLPKALRESPGCIGVETARTASGKDVIFAWFEDKKAVEKWYYGQVHRESMKQFFPEGGGGKPLVGVPDDSGPILTIASITFSDKAHFEEHNLPSGQISIELYAPIKGGIFLGETFAPMKMKVPGIKDYTPRSPSAKSR